MAPVRMLARGRVQSYDESVTVDPQKQKVSVREPMRNMKPLSQTNEIIEEDLKETQARCMYEMCSWGESHDQESGARRTGCQLALKSNLPYKEGHEFRRRNEASVIRSKG